MRQEKNASAFFDPQACFEELLRVLLILAVLMNHSDPAAGHPRNGIVTYYL
jgi:hypothetical protein